MFVILELVGYLIIDFLFAVPGAILRWMHLKISDKKEDTRDYSTRNAGWYYICGIILIMVISLLIQVT